ncbi:MAG: IS110 family transposase, partial [Bryobacterales bacterium]|nr:IS110 family transposase [Bryobacterales bacterium]
QVRETVQVGNRLRKVLEDANIKLDSVASDLLGLSGRTMLQAIIAGEENPAVLAELARSRMRSKIPELTLALEGRVRPHHRFPLKEWMWMLDRLEEQIRIRHVNPGERYSGLGSQMLWGFRLRRVSSCWAAVHPGHSRGDRRCV